MIQTRRRADSRPDGTPDPNPSYNPTPNPNPQPLWRPQCIHVAVAGTADARSVAVDGFRALTRQARCQARLLQPHQMVALLEALAVGAGALHCSTAGAPRTQIP